MAYRRPTRAQSALVPPLRQLQRLPGRVAIALVLGSAVVTATVLAAADSILSGGSDKPPEQAAAPKPRPKLLELGNRYPRKKAQPKPRAAPAPAQPAQPSVPLSRLVGAKVIVRFTGTTPPPDLLRRVRAGLVGGVILFPDNIGSRAQVRALTGALRRAARQGGSAGFVVAVDQEGGEVKRLSGPPNRSPTQLAAAGSGAAEAEGAATGRYLSSLGINVDLAPVLDVPVPGSFIASRTFGSTPAGVARVGGAFAAGLEGSGVAATLKHFPGLGRATANTDTGSSSVGASRSALRRDMAPFGAAIDGGASMVMMSSAGYPSLAGGPAVLSPAVVRGELRQRLGFDGVVVTDDLEGGAVRAVMPPGAAAVAAARAGVDMVLFAQRPESGTAAYEALYAAARSGRLGRSPLERSYG